MRRCTSWASPRYARRKVTGVSGWYRGRDRVQVRRTCAGVLLRKEAAITRSPGRCAPVATAHGAPVDVAHGARRLIL